MFTHLLACVARLDLGLESSWCLIICRHPPGPTPHSDPSCSNGIRGSGTCCSATCGLCGGTTCAHEPGGAEHCCTSTIREANYSCNNHVAPCVIADKSVTSSIVSHATFSASGSGTKVLIVRKTGDSTGSTTVSVEVCANPRLMPPGAWPLDSAGRLTRLVGSEGRDTSATHGRLTLAGRTLTGSLDGKWVGDEIAEMVHARDGPSGQVCYDVAMGSYSAALLTLQAGLT